MKKLKRYIKKHHKKIIQYADIALIIIFAPSLLLFYLIGPWNTWFVIYILMGLSLRLSFVYHYHRLYQSIFILILIGLWSLGVHQSNIIRRKTIQPCKFTNYSTTFTSAGAFFGLPGSNGGDKLYDYYIISTPMSKVDADELDKCAKEPRII